ASDFHAAGAIGGPRNRGIQAELASVFGDFPCVPEVQPEIPQRLVGAASSSRAENAVVDQRLRLHVTAGKEQPPCLVDELAGARVQLMDGRPGPDRLLVELDALAAGIAEDHGAQASVAHRKGLDPLVCGLGIPEDPRLPGWLRSQRYAPGILAAGRKEAPDCDSVEAPKRMPDARAWTRGKPASAGC